MGEPSRRFLVAGLLVALAEAGLGVATLGTGIDGYLFAVAAVTALFAVAVHRLLVAGPADPPDPPPGGHEPPDPEPPPWWPEFEAELRGHLHDRDRTAAPV